MTKQVAMLPIDTSARLPAHTGLAEVAFGQGGRAESRVDLSEMWRVVARWWWVIAAITFTCFLAAVVISLLMTPVYRAKATIEVNPEGVQVVEMGKLESRDGGDRGFMNTQAGLLRSRALAERVARSVNLANDPDVLDQELSRGQREKLAATIVAAGVEIEPERESRLIQISVENDSAERAAQIANSYADNFIQTNLERKFEATSYARTFLQQRIATVKGRLEESERALVAYAKAQGIVTLSVDSGGSGTARNEQSIDAASLIQINEALSRARSERIAAEQSYRRAAGAQAAASVIANPTVQALQQQLAQLEAEYQQKRGLFKPDYPEMVQLRSRIDTLSSEIERQSQRVGGATSGALRAEFEAAVARENALQGRVDQLKNALVNLRGRSIQYTILQREVDTNRSLYDALLQRFKEVGVAGGVGVNVVSVVDRAETPLVPFTPNLPLNIGLGLLAGLVIGVGTVFAIEWIDDTIKTPDDLTQKLGLAALGVIPMLSKNGGTIQQELGDPRSPTSEAYHSVRTALQFSTDHGVPRTLLITSTRAGEGKSSTALALSHTLASLGARVLLIDADMRKPTFRVSTDGQGLSGLLVGVGTLEECIHQTAAANLSLLPSGAIPPNPAELLASGRLKAILQQAIERFDHVVIDGPPVLGLADAPLLTSLIEGTVMVIESGGIRRAAALTSVSRLRAADARIMGGVLTKFNARKTGYGYGYGYGSGEEMYVYKEGDEPKRQIELLKID